MAPVALGTKNSTNGPESTHVLIEGAVQKTDQASSSESLNTVDFVAHSTPPPQINVLVDDEVGDSEEMPEGTSEDRGASAYWETAFDFASDITRAAKNVLLNRRPYFKEVVAVIAYWETATGLQHLRNQADKLGTLFEDSFKFKVLVYKIPATVSDRKFVATIGDELDKVSNDRDSLFILYYGGHASMEESTTVRLWKKENHPKSPEIEWSSAIRSLFKTEAICSKLFIFDCCHAGGMIDPTLAWDTSCELLGACAADVQASALKVSSFTRAFFEEVSNNTYDILELHSALCSTDKRLEHNLAKFPYYQDFMGHESQSASALIKKVGPPDESQDLPRTPSNMLARLESISDAVVCIAVTFKCTAETFMEEIEVVKKNWRRWFKFAPTECDDIIVKACHSTELIAVFNSNSCITIWSFPVWLWGAMAPLSGYQYIGIIRPQNLALPATARTDLAVPDCSLNTIVGEVSLSPQPSKPDKLPPVQDTILEGRTGEDDPHLESIKPPSATSTEAKATSKLPTKNLPEQPVQHDRISHSRWRNKYFSSTSHKKKQESSSSELSTTPLSSSPFLNSSRTSPLDELAELYLSCNPPNLVDLIHDPSEKRKASRIQRFMTLKEVRDFPARAQITYVTV